VRIILFKRITIWEIEIVRAVGLTCGKIFQRVIVKPAAINPKDQVIVHLGFVARVTGALTCTWLPLKASAISPIDIEVIVVPVLPLGASCSVYDHGGKGHLALRQEGREMSKRQLVMLDREFLY